MCNICRQSPCDRRCPNAEPPVYELCDYCDSEIDGYAVIGRDGHCSECWDAWIVEHTDFTDVEDYVQENRRDYLQFWFDSLSDDERIDFIEAAWFDECVTKKLELTKMAKRQMKEFALDDIGDFYKFVMGEE